MASSLLLSTASISCRCFFRLGKFEFYGNQTFQVCDLITNDLNRLVLIFRRYLKEIDARLTT